MVVGKSGRLLWNMNRSVVFVLFALKCVLFASASYAGMPHERVLHGKMVWLDYLGVENLLKTGNPFDSNPLDAGSGMNRTIDAFLKEPVEGLSMRDISFICSSHMTWLYEIVVLAEANGVSGNKDKFMRYGTGLAEIMGVLDRRRDVMGDLVPRWLRNQVESMLARLLNDRRQSTVRLLPSDIRELLPEFGVESARYKEFHVSFRNMLVVGAAIERHLRENGRMPDSLSELGDVAPDEKKDAYGEPLSYRHKGDDWMLHSGGREKAKDDGPWNVYVPYIECIGGWLTDEVWFSSTFSRCRKELYSNGVINDNHPAYRCYMHGNAMYRGDRPGTSHQLGKTKD